MTDKHQPIARIEVDGVPFEALGLHGVLNSILLEQSNQIADMVEIKLTNFATRITSAELLGMKKDLDLWLGFRGGLEYMGKFQMQKPRTIFPENGPAQVIIKGYGEVIKMAKDEKRRTFEKMKDSDIAKKIAGEYGFTTEIEDSGTKYDQVSQMGISDIVFLRERAKLYGYQCYVRYGVFHFHPAEYDDSNIRVMHDSGDNRNEIQHFEVKSHVFQGATKVTATNIDKLKKEVVKETSKNEPDEISAGIKGGFRTYSPDLVYPKEPQAERFLEFAGHYVNREELKKHVKAVNQDGVWVFSADTKIAPGNSKLQPGKVCELAGLYHLSGKYYINEAIHLYSAEDSALKSTLKVMSSYMGSRSGREFFEAANIIASAVKPELLKLQDVMADAGRLLNVVGIDVADAVTNTGIIK